MCHARGASRRLTTYRKKSWEGSVVVVAVHAGAVSPKNKPRLKWSLGDFFELVKACRGYCQRFYADGIGLMGSNSIFLIREIE